MNPVQTIACKRDGQRLSDDQIAAFVEGYVAGEIPDYQMAALAMAIYLRGMDASETAALTERMLASGTQLAWPAAPPFHVDKHSTGGIGDKVSLILAPLLACCGLRVPMLSGRGLGATEGTLDKLESIPGFRTDLSLDEIRRQTETIGCVITGTTAELAPADRKLYALRDVTATVASIPLITASIMSKKLAAGLDALVLDVKHGNGAFMKSAEQARALAESLVSVGERMGVATTALLTDMNQPLGRMCGNAIEVDESLDCLAGGGPPDLRQLVLRLGAELLLATRLCDHLAQAEQRLAAALDSGQARDKFGEMVHAQGGDLQAPRRRAPVSLVVAARDGSVIEIATEALGWTIIDLGGGRKKLAEPIDHSVGLEIQVRVGDRVERGQPLARIFAHNQQAESAQRAVAAAITLGDQSAPRLPLVTDRVTHR